MRRFLSMGDTENIRTVLKPFEDVEDGKKQLQFTTFDVLGICCPGEARLIERLLKPLEGFEGVTVNVSSKIATVLHDPLILPPPQIVKVLNQARLDATIQVRGQLKTGRRWPSFYTIGCGVILLISFCKVWYGPFIWFAIGAVLVGLPPIILRSFVALRNFVLDINVLMLIAVTGSVGLGDYLEAGSIVFLFTLSEWLESRSIETARASLNAVMNLAPQTAVLQETQQKVPVEEVQINSLLSVKAGEAIPIDGVVVSGRSTLDESSLTGESIPVVKDVGSHVWASTLNITADLCVRTTALASESTVARMVKLVEEAQNQHSQTEQIVQQFAKYYTPVVVLIAAGMVAEGCVNKERRREWFYLALEMLVISCPCALVISTPVATTCALIQAAKMRLLIKGSNFIETLGRLKAVALDKTGTLTEGIFRVTYAQFMDSSSIHRHSVLHWIMSLESKSSHPMSLAMVSYARESGVEIPPADVDDFQTIPGEGIHGIVNGYHVYIGNARLASHLGWKIPEHQRNEGTTICYIGTDDTLLSIFHVADALREEAHEAIAKFKKLGLKIIILTGDTWEAATEVQAQLGEGIKACGGLLPEEKVKEVELLRREVGPTAMVGDGINDAPALATADIGIAMGVVGSSMAMETADMALMSNDLRRIANGIALGRRCMRIIYVNVAISLVTKLAIVALAIMGHVALWAAVVADVGTCLLVTLNSMMLLFIPSQPAEQLPSSCRTLQSPYQPLPMNV